jgi:hypothetical protein
MGLRRTTILAVAAGALATWALKFLRFRVTPFRRSDLYTGKGSIWTWFNDPRAIKISATKALVGGVSENGSVIVRDLDLSTLKFGPVTVLSDKGDIDDHNNPGFSMFADGSVLALFAGHFRPYYYSRRRRPDGSWLPRTEIQAQLTGTDFSYANPILMDDGKLVNFYRPGNDQTISISTDNGVTWPAGALLLQGSRVRPYLKVRKSGSARIDIICTDGHPDEVAQCSVYHFYFDTSAGTYHSSAGTNLGERPFTPSTSLTRIYDGTSIKAWVWDLTIHSGSPVACFSRFVSATDHHYRQARFNGSVWSHSEICAAGGYLYPEQPSYSGGLVTDPLDRDTVYCSRQVDGSGNVSLSGTWQLFRYRTTDGGATWVGTQLTFGAQHCFRPYIPEGARVLLFNKATTYVAYTNYQSEVGVLAIS